MVHVVALTFAGGAVRALSPVALTGPADPLRAYILAVVPEVALTLAGGTFQGLFMVALTSPADPLRAYIPAAIKETAVLQFSHDDFFYFGEHCGLRAASPTDWV